jgi:hypothetical protein
VPRSLRSLERGVEAQLTKKGGFLAFESADGEDLYYPTVDGALAKRPVGGGSETIILKSIYWLDFAAEKHGVYFIDGSSGTSMLKFVGRQNAFRPVHYCCSFPARPWGGNGDFAGRALDALRKHR